MIDVIEYQKAALKEGGKIIIIIIIMTEYHTYQAVIFFKLMTEQESSLTKEMCKSQKAGYQLEKQPCIKEVTRQDIENSAT